jgi:3',5'-cyclic AMP phosphodiesterase CpdA
MASSLLLHLSDLHLSPVDQRDAVADYKSDIIPAEDRMTRRNTLENTLRALAAQLDDGGRRLEAVVITGDVTYQCESLGFALLEETLASLGNQLPAPDHIIIVPGNHDVRWGTDPGSADRYGEFVENVREKGYVTPLLDGVDLQPNGTRTSDVNPIYVSDNANFSVIAMNSSNYCGTREPLHGVDERDLEEFARHAERDAAFRRLNEEIERLRIADVARLSPAQLGAIGALLRDPGRQTARPFSQGGPIRIAALHHQLLPVSVAEEVKPYETITNLGDVRDFLHSNQIDIVLHGHKHVSHLYWDHCYDYGADEAGFQEAGAGRPVLVCSAGSIGSVGTEVCKLIEVDTHLPHVHLVRVTRVPAMSAGRPLSTNLRTDSVRLRRSQPVTADSTPTLLTGESVTDVYHQLTEKFDDETVQRLRNVICYVARGDTALALPQTYPEVKGYAGDQRAIWFNEIVDWWQRDISNLRSLRFTHGERIFRFAETIDQLANAVAALKADLGTGRAVIALFDPRVDAIERKEVKFPAFCYLQFVVSDTRQALDCVAFFRSQEMRFWWPINMAEIARLQRHVIQQLEEDHVSLVPGAIVTQTAIAYPGKNYPKVIIPMLDRIWQDDRNRLWSMAYALFHYETVDREERLKDWQLLFEDWLPGDQVSPGGVPVPVEGLEALRDAVKFFSDKHGSTPGRRVTRILSLMLDANNDYLQQELRSSSGRERRDAHQRWRDRIMEHAEDLEQALADITSTTTSET